MGSIFGMGTRDAIADNLDAWYKEGEKKMNEICNELPYDVAVKVRQWYLDGRAGLDSRLAWIRNDQTEL